MFKEMTRKTKITIATVLFFIVVIADTYAVITQNKTMEMIFKPLLMFTLAIVYLISTKKINKWLIFGLFFSFLGDVFLLDQENYFVFGVASFLVTHVFYIKVIIDFLKVKSFVKIFLSMLPFLALYLTTVSAVYGNLKEMLIPVVEYGLVVCVFGGVTFFYYQQTKIKSSLFLLISAVLLAFSDSFLIFNLYYSYSKLLDFFVILLYIFFSIYGGKRCFVKRTIFNKIRMKRISLFFLILSVFSCKKESLRLHFLDEFTVKDSLEFQNTIIGGISGIDFYNNQYYMVVDDARNPRILVADINLDKESIKYVNFKKVINIDTTSLFFKNNALDLEAVFISDNQITLASEGAIRKGKDPIIFIVDTLGNYQNIMEIPAYFKANSLAKPKHNATFESSSISYDNKGFWIGMEGVLAVDGEEPNFYKTQSPVRITYFDNQTKKATKQFAYQLEKIDKPAKGTINLNGVTAILEYKKNSFFVVERIYQSGYGAFGNTVRIFKASIDELSTNTLTIRSLKEEKFIPLKKELLIDFKTIKNKLKDKIIDNVEGITFGPKLSNGNRTLLLVSDDNFQIYGKQLNQFLLLEIDEK